MKILFHENQLCYRGTSVAVYDYAHYNEVLLGNKSYVVYDKRYNSNLEAIERFSERFTVFGYNNPDDIDEIIAKNDIDVFYAIKSGAIDLVKTDKCKCVIHTVFKNLAPHGDVYAYVSRWLSEEMTSGKYPYVPHIVSLPNHTENLRDELNIPKTAKVFGYYGGGDSFDIRFVQRVVKKIARENENIYFIFMGVDSFIKKRFFFKTREYSNIIFLPYTTNIIRKVKFINTCDAMLHARLRGETFGIAIGEFAIKGKPIITYSKSVEKNHILELENDAFYYSNKKELLDILLNTELNKKNAIKNYSKFTPELVMQKFKQVFID